VLARRQARLRDELALLELGQPVLSRTTGLAHQARAPRRRHVRARPRLLRRLLEARLGAGAPARGAPRRRRLQHGDLPMSLPLAHVGGIPVEETVGMIGPALLVALGAATATVRARWRRVRRQG